MFGAPEEQIQTSPRQAQAIIFGPYNDFSAIRCECVNEIHRAKIKKSTPVGTSSSRQTCQTQGPNPTNSLDYSDNTLANM